MIGAEPIWAAGRPGPLQGAGVLVCHGFSGSPASVRDSAQYLIDQGAAVVCPLLPGHGTTWQQMRLTTHQDWYSVLPPALDWLTERTRVQVVIGLSMGGSLALRIAQLEQVAGVALVNPSVGTDSATYRLVPLLAKVLPTVRGIGSDIKAQGVTEPSYPRAPLAAVASMRELWRLVVREPGFGSGSGAVVHLAGRPRGGRVFGTPAAPSAAAIDRPLAGEQLPRRHHGQRRRLHQPDHRHFHQRPPASRR